MKKTTMTVILSIFCVLIVLCSVFTFVSCDKGESNSDNLDETFADGESESSENSAKPDETSQDDDEERDDYIENPNEISTDVDLESWFYAVFQPKSSEIDENTGARLESTAKSLENLLFERGYTEAVISLEDNNRIRVEVPDVDDPEEICYLIGRPASFELRKERYDEIPSSTPYVTTKDIEEAHVSLNNSGQYVIALELNSLGTAKLAAASEERKGSTISIWMNGECLMSPIVNSVITNGKIVIEGNYTFIQAYELAIQIQAGAFDVNLQLVEADKVMVRPDANEGELAK